MRGKGVHNIEVVAGGLDDPLFPFEARRISGDPVVQDLATGLEWHPGSGDVMDYYAAREWIIKLNAQEYADGPGWRLPTVEEAASLMAGRKSATGLYMDVFFSSGPALIWTGDEYNTAKIWYVGFEEGKVLDAAKINLCYVRPVRCLKTARRAFRYLAPIARATSHIPDKIR